jgi:hypothetical protein
VDKDEALRLEDALAGAGAAFDPRAWTAVDEAYSQAEARAPLEADDLVRSCPCWRPREAPSAVPRQNSGLGSWPG